MGITFPSALICGIKKRDFTKYSMLAVVDFARVGAAIAIRKTINVPTQYSGTIRAMRLNKKFLESVDVT
jgi:hypothetical protein